MEQRCSNRYAVQSGGNHISSMNLRFMLLGSGVPHCAMEDGIVNGYLIPKKSIIIANLW